MTDLDPRLNAFRPDLADATLSGSVNADSFVSPTRARVVRRAAIVRKNPSLQIPRETELLLGEQVNVFEVKNGWAWVQSCTDQYVGYIAAEDLGDSSPAPTHYVVSITSPIHPEPKLKTLPIGLLGFRDQVCVVDQTDKWSMTSEGYWLYTAHLREASALEGHSCDPATTALRFLEVPYLWGGRNGQGVDCSSLVQFALMEAGLPCPRDSDQQERQLGNPVPHLPYERSLKRNDLVFWPGHVGMMVDDTRLIHANATDMAVRLWDLKDVEEHIKNVEATSVTSIKRLSFQDAGS